jgi:hypothetical protein
MRVTNFECDKRHSVYALSLEKKIFIIFIVSDMFLSLFLGLISCLNFVKNRIIPADVAPKS